MKQIVFILSVILLMGCSTIGKFPYVQESSIIDYSQYEKKCFFITESNSVSFEYKPIGSIMVKVENGYEVISVDKKESSIDDIYGQKKISYKKKFGDYKVATINDALDLIYNKSIEKNADGIINIKIEPIIGQNPYQTNTITGYFVSGMAIKRK